MSGPEKSERESNSFVDADAESVVGPNAASASKTKEVVNTFYVESESDAKEVLAVQQKATDGIWTWRGTWGVEKYKGNKELDAYYHVATEKLAKIIRYSQWRVKKKIWTWRAIWYSLWGLVPFAVTSGIAVLLGLPGWEWLLMAIVGVAVSEVKAYAEYQTRHIKIVHAGGPREKKSKKNIGGVGSAGVGGLYAFLAILAGIWIMGYFDIMGASEWGFFALMVVVVVGIGIALSGAIKLPVKPTAPSAEKVDPDDELPEIGVWEIDDVMVPADVLGPGGRYDDVHNWLVRVRVVTKKMPKLDIDTKVTAQCQNGAELTLVTGLTAQFPIDNPFEVIEGFKIKTKADIASFIDNPIKTAARRLIAAAKDDLELTAANADFGDTVLTPITGKLIPNVLGALVDAAKKVNVLVPIANVYITNAAINVDLSEAQKKIRQLKAEAEGKQTAEKINARTTIILVEELLAQAKKSTPAIELSLAQALLIAQRIQKNIITTNIDVTSGDGLADILRAMGGIEKILATFKD